MASVAGTQAYILGVCEDLPRAENRVDLDPTVKDVYGLPVARVTYANHPNDVAVGAYVAGQLVPIGEAMLQAIGAGGTVGVTAPTPTPLTSYEVAPRYVVHQHGTMRMGSSPQSSVVNRYGQFWDIPNLFVADGSLFTTAGGYNPTHTIEALAHWVASYIAANRETVLERPRPLVAASVGVGLPDTAAAGASTAAAGAAGTLAVAAGVAHRKRRRDDAEPSAGA
jgi:choline dehydrogenase-like flavoprotein